MTLHPKATKGLSIATRLIEAEAESAKIGRLFPLF
jgi:hypothetical protein